MTDPPVLVVVAHPDDEVFASGVICLCADAGIPVDLVSLTSGEGGGPGEDLAERRTGEFQCSASALGARSALLFQHPDVADPERAWSMVRIGADLDALIERLSPQVILTHGPGGGYGNRAHVLTFEAVMAAATRAVSPVQVFSFSGRAPPNFFTWRQEGVSDVLIDARGFDARRIASLACHHSQLDFFLQPYQPGTLRKRLSASFGRLFAFTESGRKRVTIASPGRFFSHLPFEGLTLQRSPTDGGPHFFQTRFAHDHRVSIVA